MKKLILIGVIAIAVLLIGASAVFAQDGTETTPGTAVTSICPTAGAAGVNLDQMKQMHDSMGQNVPEGMQQMHDSMTQALQSGDTEQIQQLRSVCQSQHNVQQ